MSSEVKNRKDKRPSAKKSDGRAQFINYKLNESDKAGLPAFREKLAEDLWGIIDKLAEQGYKLSVAEDSYNECFAAYLSANSEGHPNNGLILSGKARSSEMAVVGLLYRHYIVFEERWPERDAQNRYDLDDA